MKLQRIPVRFVLLGLSWMIFFAFEGYQNTAFAQGTAFTYQGRLTSGGSPANGAYDFRLRLYQDSLGNVQVGDSLFTNGVPISNGLFIVTLDFGPDIFTGSNYWLELDVRTNGGSSYSDLTPLQSITPAPYAIFANTASNLSGTLPASQLSGTVSSANLSGIYSNVVTFSNVADSFNGNGNGLSAVNALTLGGLGASGFWQTSGNAGTTPGPNYLGTSDAQPLELHVNGQRALRLEPGPATNPAPNVIGGSLFNSVSSGAYAATIGGGGQLNFSNTVTADFATVSGGGSNTASGWASTVSGGAENTAGSPDGSATVGGGYQNTATGDSSAVSGGSGNTVRSSFSTAGGGLSNAILTNTGGSVIAGGEDNIVQSDYFILSFSDFSTISGGFSNAASSYGGTIGGGIGNIASTPYVTIGGGLTNTAGGWGATVGGGGGNVASNYYGYPTVGGGFGNIASGQYSSVLGGWYNSATNFASTVGGGWGNYVNGELATVAGGLGNEAAGYAAAVGGGNANTAAGQDSIAPGGVNNYARGDFSFAAGYGAQALHDGAFVWADDEYPNTFASTAANQFAVRASGGILFAGDVQLSGGAAYHNLSLSGGNSVGYLYGSYPALGDGIHLGYNYYYDAGGNGHVINTGGATTRMSVGYGYFGVYVGAVNAAPSTPRIYADASGVSIYGTFNNYSDRNAKQDFASIHSSDVLDKVSRLPLSEWSYKEDPKTRHVGPMAQDFYSVFNIGTDDKHIAPMDEGGVALAAIQGLNEKVEDADRKAKTEIEALKAENVELKARLEKLEELVNSSPSRR